MSQARVLVVEDEALVAADLQDCLTSLGYEVVGTTDNAVDALAVCQSAKPDLALLDIRIHGPVDGIELSTQLDIPFIFLTAHADVATLERAATRAPFGYILKPFDERQLQAAIEAALGRFQGERQLQQAQRWLATTLGSIGEGVVACNLMQEVTFVNGVFEKLTGWTSEEAIGQPVGTVVDIQQEEQGTGTLDIFTHVLERDGRVSLTEGAYMKPRHSSVAFPIACSASPILGGAAGDQLLGAVMVFRDRTNEVLAARQKAEVERRLMNAQRLEGLGLLAGGMAHRFNNLLAGMLANIQLCQLELATEHTSQPLLEETVEFGQKGAALCRQMLAFSGRAPTASKLNLNRFLVDAMDLLRASVPKTVSFTLDLADELPEMMIDESQVQQVLTNLVVNAADALERGRGQVVLRTYVKILSDREAGLIAVGRCASAGTYVVLEVTDDGHGMTDDVIAHAFEPFFSTRAERAGLGLAAVEGILRTHDAGLDLVSQAGGGTTVRVYLPARAAAERVSTRPPVHRPCALVVESNASVRSALSIIVSELGLDLEVAGDLDAANALLQTKPRRFKLLLLDLGVLLPQQLHWLDEVQARDPGIKIGLLSGYSEAFAKARLGAYSVSAHIRKPFSRDEARRRLEAALTS